MTRSSSLIRSTREPQATALSPSPKGVTAQDSAPSADPPGKRKARKTRKKANPEERFARPLLARFQESLVEAGVDEAGRGCLAGPVVASAVVLPEGWNHPLLNDSKKLHHEERELLRVLIERHALAWAVAFVGPATIDRVNILNASFMAMHQALDRLKPRPEFLVIDGNRFKPWHRTPHTCVIKGDGAFRHVAAASILAKTHRDRLMDRMHERDPRYSWNSNRGYPTPAHRQAIKDYGATEYHRRSFRLLPVPEQGDLFAQAS